MTGREGKREKLTWEEGANTQYVIIVSPPTAAQPTHVSPLFSIIGFYHSRGILPGHRSRPINRSNSFGLTKHKTLLLCQTPQINIELEKTWKTTTLSRRQSHCSFHNSFRADCYTHIDPISTGWGTRRSSIRLVSHVGARFINILFFLSTRHFSPAFPKL